MKLPNKIYLNIPKQTLEIPLDSTTWDIKEFDDCINVEYIRKDKLIEYIDKELTENRECREICPNDRFFGGKEVAFEYLIDKIESL